MKTIPPKKLDANIFARNYKLDAGTTFFEATSNYFNWTQNACVQLCFWINKY